MIGTTINKRYKIESELGKGGMGTVYRAHDETLKRDVALKLLSNTRLGTEGRARMLREAQVSAKLDHPNIVTVYDAGEHEETPYIVMQLVEGETLAEKPPNGIEESVNVIKQICAALEHAHESGIVHRDLKPENVVVDPKGVLKLMDFGLARSVASRLTVEGTIMGTVFYMSPEQAMGDEVNHRADLYSLGIMFYEMVTDGLPFEAEDPIGIITQHIHSPVVPPIARNENLPGHLNALIVRLLSKDSIDRPEDAKAVLAILEAPPEDVDIVEEELSVLDRISRGKLIGRRSELTSARELWQKSVDGQGQLLMVSGDPGIGKTRFTREIITAADVTGGMELLGASYAEGGVPYAAFRQILRKGLRSKVGRKLDLPTNVLIDLLTLAPDLRSSYPDLKEEISQDPIDPQTLMESFSILISMLSAQVPVLLVLEDAHWADSGSLSLLRHLTRSTQDSRVMITATYREIEIHENRAFHDVLLDFNRERLGTRVKLGRLDKTQTEEMLTALFHDRITPEFLDGIYKETEGHPFFIEEVVKALVESGKLEYKDGDWDRPSIEELGIPQSVHVAIQSRLDQLDEAAQDVLRQAAIIGREFDLDMLKIAVKMDEDDLIDILETAEKAQLIQEIKGSSKQVRFEFEHALIPTTLVEDTRTLQKRKMHRRAGEALEKVSPNEWDLLGHHFLEGGEVEKAVGYLIQAGDRARQLYANQEAIQHYEQTLDYLREKEDYDLAARTMMKLAQTYQNNFDFAASSKVYEEAFEYSNKVVGSQSERDLPLAPHPFRTNMPEPISLDSAMAGDVPSGIAISNMFDGLVEMSSQGVPIPAVAERWEVMDKGLTYQFYLREDVFWSDGVQVTAHDFEYAFKRMLSPEIGSQQAELLFVIKNGKAYKQGDLRDTRQVGVEVIDDQILEIRLEHPVGYFLQLMAHTSAFPVPRHAVEKHGVAWAEDDKIVTNGPFRLKEWKRGEMISYTRNQDYYGGFLGNIEELQSIFSKNELDLYSKNKVDVAGFIFSPIKQQEAAQKKFADEFVMVPAHGLAFMGCNVLRAPLDDVRVRRALAMAIDKNTLAGSVYKGMSAAANGGMVPPGVPGYSPNIGLSFNPEEARKLIAEAGFPDGKGFPKLELHFGNTAINQMGITYIVDMWQELLGITVISKPNDFNEHLEITRVSQPDLWMMGWNADYPDPHNFVVESSWRSDETHGQLWQHDEFDRLMVEVEGILDQEKRIELYKQADKILMEEVPVIPIAYNRFQFLAKPWIKGFAANFDMREVIIEPHEGVSALPPAPHPLRLTFPEPISIDPGLGVEFNSSNVINVMFRGLVELSPQGVVVPAAAKRWEVVNHGLMYRFHLREDVFWSDGVKLTAADFEFAIKRVLSPALNSMQANMYFIIKNGEAYHKGDLDDPEKIGVKALNDLTLEIHLEKPVGYFLQLLAYNIAFPVPRHVVEEHGLAWTDDELIVTNGPFKLKEWKRGEMISFIRNENYYGAFSGNLEEYQIFFPKNEPMSLNEYIKDEIDVFTLTYAKLEDRVSDQQKVTDEFLMIPYPQTAYIGFDVTQAPFDDVRVRRALAMSIDKDTLFGSVLKGGAAAAKGGFIPPGVPGHSPNLGLSYDSEQARVLLAEAGYPEGKDFPKFEILGSAGNETLKYITDHWQEVLGIKITPKLLDWEKVLEITTVKKPVLWTIGWTADYPDPHNFLMEAEWHRDETRGWLWQHAEFERLVKEAAEVFDQEKRIKLYKQADKIIVEEAPIIPLSHFRVQLLVKPWITGWKNYFWTMFDPRHIVIEPH